MDIAGWNATVIENGVLEAVVLPGRGGDVWALRHLATDTQALWHAPWPMRRGPTVPAAAAFDDWYAGGWQDLLPNGDAACLVDGVQHAFHGESWAHAWRVVDRGDDRVSLVTELVAVPLSVERELRLTGATLEVREHVRNTGTADARFLWGHHPALGGDLLEVGCEVDIPGGTVETYHEQVDATSALAIATRSRWPLATAVDGGTVDLSRVPGPQHGTHDVALVSDLKAGWFAVRNPRRDIGFALRFPREVFSWLWIWQAFGGARTPPFGPDTYTLAIEPWTGPPVLARAVSRGEHAQLAPGEALEVVIEATLFQPARMPVSDVAAGGAVRTR